MAGEGTTWPWPAFMSRIDCSNSSPMSRFASKASISAFVRRLLFEATANLLEFGSWDVSGVALRIDGQEHGFAFFCTGEIDNPDTAGFSGARARPSNFPHSSGLPYYNSRRWVQGYKRCEFSTLFLGPVQRPELLEQRAFDNSEHGRTMRLRRMIVKDVLMGLNVKTTGTRLRAAGVAVVWPGRLTCYPAIPPRTAFAVLD